MALDDYNPQTARTAYYPEGSDRPARLWSIEKFVHDAAAAGLLSFFEGAGSDPTSLPVYAVDKIWLRSASGVTPTTGEVRGYAGAGDATLLASWPVLDRAGLRRHLSVYSRTETDALVAAGLPPDYVVLVEKTGILNRLRTTQAVIAGFDRKGFTGPGNPDFLPKAITASQTGSTVTASTALFQADHVGKLVEWASGEEALIATTPVNIGTGWASQATAPMDRAQTVANGAAVVNAKSLTFCLFGNSIQAPVSNQLARRWWRALGYGGIVITPGAVDNTVLVHSAAELAGGASDMTTTLDYATIPWSRWWNVPTGGSVTWYVPNPYSAGVYREYPAGLRPESMHTDTGTVTWRRGAGSFTVQRKRITDPDNAYVVIDTVADASAGSTAFVTKKYKHAIGFGWQYRAVTTSGTIKFVQHAQLNRTTPGYVHWPLITSGSDISNFLLLPAADLAELSKANQVDCVLFHMAMGRIGMVLPSDYLPDLTLFRAQWATSVSPRKLDHLWVTPWEVEPGSQAQGSAYGAALRQLAILNDDPYASFESLYGDYATMALPSGWEKDTVHPSQGLGAAVAADHLDGVLRISGNIGVKESRPVDAPSGNFDLLSIRQRDVGAQITALRQRPATTGRGCKWNTGTMAPLVGAGALAAPLGFSDFTITLDMDFLTTVPVQHLITINSSLGAIATASGFEVWQEGGDINLLTRDGAGTSRQYRFSSFGTAYGGRRGALTIRTNRANNLFDLFFDGEPMLGLVPTTPGVGGAALSAWNGAGQDVAIRQGSSAAYSSTVYSAMVWRSARPDAEIRANMYADAPNPAALPDLWWDFAEGIGRVVRDRSGNNKHAQILVGNPQQYHLTTAPTWARPGSGLAPPWLANLGATTTLIAGDDVIAAYSANRDMTLPAAPQLGDEVRVTKRSAAVVKYAQPANHSIRFGALTTTAGTAGKLEIASFGGSAHLKCIYATAGTYEWAVMASAGTLTPT